MPDPLPHNFLDGYIGKPRASKGRAQEFALSYFLAELLGAEVVRNGSLSPGCDTVNLGIGKAFLAEDLLQCLPQFLSV
jgi:hypothetical protein